MTVDTDAPAAPTTRDRLLTAAHDLVAEGGYAAATVTAVAERTGLAAGALYRHFPSKAHLFAELFRTVCDGELRAMVAAAEATADRSAGDRTVAVITTFARRALRSRRLAWALLAEPVDPLVEAERLAFRRAYRDLYVDLLRQGVHAGELPEQDVELTAAAVVGAVGEALVGPLSPVEAGGTDPDDVVDAIGRIVRGAIGA
ncbi:MAG: TetR/AcrR family transcriptional regulator [Solirubrobacteraceae bacterium]|nr:TetR/AcrR family transcriptional regulator [Solirubrobacteraceae bacterium]